MNVPTLLASELSDWSGYIHQLTGIHLDATKAYLIETRLNRLYTETGARNWADLLAMVRRDSTQRLRHAVISGITTNETSFFRDSSPFDLLRHKLIPELIDRRQREAHRYIPIRVLSAACSTGQEAYSIAMILKELLGSFAGYQILIQGIDISDVAIQKASSGYFTQLEIDRGLPVSSFTSYFTKSGSGWKIADELRSITTFQRRNLLEPFAGLQPFDIILCRNVAIYFQETDRRRLFSNLGTLMAPQASLIIGSTESITSLCPEYEQHRHLRAAYYTRPTTVSTRRTDSLPQTTAAITTPSYTTYSLQSTLQAER
jgi:chemotaxis protein methyltransferase CheR